MPYTVWKKTMSSGGAGGSSPSKSNDGNNNRERRLFQFENSKLTLEEFIKEWNTKVGWRKDFFEKNSKVQYEDFEKLVKGKKLDSNLKKCTAFVRKVRHFHESFKSCAESDIRNLNLTKYIGEISLDIVQLRNLKSSDISSLLGVCAELHKRYREFGVELLKNFENALMVKDLTSCIKLCTDLRLYIELVLGGIIPMKDAFVLLIKSIQNLASLDKDGTQLIPVLVALLRDLTFELIGVIPRDVRVVLEDHVCQTQLIRSSEIGLNPGDKATLKAVFKKCFSLIKTSFVKKNDKVLGAAKFLRKQLETKGEISLDRQQTHNEMVTDLGRFHNSITKLANLLDVPIPKLRHLPINPDDDFDKELLLDGDDGDDPNDGGAMFEDEETRQFYQDIPDLKAYLADELLQRNANMESNLYEPEKSPSDKKEIEKEGDGTDNQRSYTCNEDDDDVDTLNSDSDTSDSDSELENFELDAEKAELMQQESEDNVPDYDEDILPSLRNGAGNASEESQDDVPNVTAQGKMNFRKYVTDLRNCANKSMIDKAAFDFVDNFKSKRCKAELAKHLFSLPRQRTDLLRLYCRLTATLSTIYPEIGQDICEALRKDFRFLVYKRDQQRLESKLRITRFIGELTNFGVFTKNDAFNCFKMLLRNFTHHQIDMTCCLLETCGVFLYRSRDSHRRMKVYLDEMLRRKKTSQFMQQRYAYLIDCAYYQICRPAGGSAPKKVKCPLHAYMEYVLCFDLRRETLQRANKALRKFDWKDLAKSDIALSILSSPWKLNFSQLDTAAALLVSLKQCRPTVVQAVIENISEVVRIGCEFESEDINNMRMSTCQYLANLYNYKCISTTSLLNIMYYLISYGVTYQDNVFTGMDPPDSLYRIRVICHMLRIIGEFVSTPKSNRRLDFFLKYFQRYFLYKRDLPVWEVTAGGRKRFPHYVEEMFEDTVKRVRGKWKFVKTMAEAEHEILEQDKILREKVKNDDLRKTISGERKGVGLKLPMDGSKKQLNWKPASYAKAINPRKNQQWDKNDCQAVGEPAIVLTSLTEEDEEDSEDEFEKEFLAMYADSGTASNESASLSCTISTRPKTTNVPVAKVGGFGESGKDALNYGLSKVKVTMLTKQKNKPREKTVEVESKEDFLVSIKRREDQEKKEKQEVKDRTLELSRRQLEEEQIENENSMMSALGKLGKVVCTSSGYVRVKK